MNCPGCSRANSPGLDHCDFCGTPLHAGQGGKRRTEVEASPGPAGKAHKRVTEFENLPHDGPLPAARPAGGDGFDPFAVSARGAVGAFQPAQRGGGPAGQPSGKRATEFDAGGSAGASSDGLARANPADPFGVPGASGPGAQAGVGRRIIGWLITFDGNADGASFVLREGRNVIGRDSASEVALAGDNMVSGTHAFVIWRAGRARIADANTQNGTFLNDQDVLGQIEVSDGAVIRVGRTRLLVRLVDADVAAAIWKVTAAGA